RGRSALSRAVLRADRSAAARSRGRVPPRARGALRLRGCIARRRARRRADRGDHARAGRRPARDGPLQGGGPGARRAGGSDVLGPRRLEWGDERRRDAGAAPVNVELQVIGSALRAVAEEMGAVLVRSAFSANIKERRDCSTALFDDDGRMIVQAEHIPVHLGAMPDAVAAVRGMEPASLPAFSRELYQEGLVVPPTPLTDDVVALVVANSRNPAERSGDLRAQIAAHHLAGRRVDELCERRGRARVAAAMDELYAYSDRMVRAAIVRIPDGRRSAEDVVEGVDGDLVIRATVE